MRTRTKAKPQKRAAEMKTVVRKKYSFEGDETPEEETVEVEVHEFATEPAYIRVNAGVTKSLAPYESLRVDVSLSVPCYTEEIDSIYEGVSQRVYELLEQEVDAYLNGEEDAD